MEIAIVWLVFIVICMISWGLVAFTILSLRVIKTLEKHEQQEILDDQKNDITKGW